MNLSKIFIVLACFSFELSSQVITTTENNGNLILEDIPSIPQALVDDLNKFQNVRSGSFRGFDSSGSQLFISTRFGNVSQLHLVKTPGGARKQVTYFDEPIGSVTHQPNGELIAFTMDSGGSENAQIFNLPSDQTNVLGLPLPTSFLLHLISLKQTDSYGLNRLHLFLTQWLTSNTIFENFDPLLCLKKTP